jgi:putative hydrolase of the HAD superfamily
MAAIRAVFFDVGGVVLTNGWDRTARRRAAEAFHFDWDEFEERHELVVADFETGRIGLEAYLSSTLFYQPREFTREQITGFILAQSKAFEPVLQVIGALARAKKCLVGTLNNESLDLNRYRIERFHLRDYFDVFFSSCYLGVRKPDWRIFQLALQITQRTEQECLFVDDRGLNVESAAGLGMPALRYRDAGQLEAELRRYELL